MTIVRRKLLFGTAAVAAMPFFIKKASAADITLKCAITTAPTHPLSLRLMEASKRIAEQSQGKIDFQVYPSSQLGGDIDVLAQTKIGAVQFQCVGGTTTSAMIPNAAINGVGFAFPDYDAVWGAMDGDVGAIVRQDNEKAGFFAYPKSFDNGF